jgi:WD40 repeat protein
MFVANHND